MGIYDYRCRPDFRLRLAVYFMGKGGGGRRSISKDAAGLGRYCNCAAAKAKYVYLLNCTAAEYPWEMDIELSFTKRWRGTVIASRNHHSEGSGELSKVPELMRASIWHLLARNSCLETAC